MQSNRFRTSSEAYLLNQTLRTLQELAGDEVENEMEQIDVASLMQEGRQRDYAESDCDIVIYGGAAGGGKTYASLALPLKHIHVKGFNSVLLRRLLPSIKVAGGMWDESQTIYPLYEGDQKLGDLSWTFPSGARITFSGMQYENDKLKYQGAQIALIIFDQLEEFTESQFFFMLSRNRSTCGVKPRIRATANPEPGWLANFLDWWVADDGYADLDKAGVPRYFVRVGGVIHWSNTEDDLNERFPDELPTSVTFIPSTVHDNKILLEKDPGYLTRLKSLPPVERARLLGDPVRGGNWKTKPEAGLIFNRGWYELVGEVPKGGVECLYWDMAATARDYNDASQPSFTSGVAIRKVEGMYYVRFVFAEQLSPAAVDQSVQRVTEQIALKCKLDKTRFMVRWEQEPGSAAKRESRRLVQLFDGLDAKGDKVSTGKFIRGRAFASQSEVGNVLVLNASWTEHWLEHMHNQPDIDFTDIMDASTGAYNILTGRAGIKRKARSFSG